jgi:copper(I)-binding protein
MRTRRKSPVAAALAFAAALLAAAPAGAHDYKLGPLSIGHPWSRATPPGAAVGAGYLTIANTDSEPDRLVSATVAGAGRVQIHAMAEQGGVMIMRGLTEGLEIPAGATVELAPGGYHLMLMDLARPLKEGERLAGTLRFEKAGAIDVEFAVGPLGGEPAGHDTHHTGAHGG